MKLINGSKLTKQQSAKLAGQATFVYMFREVVTGNVIYVGCTKYVGRRMTEHKSALKDLKNYASIYVYMRENNFEFFKDVEIVLVDYFQNRDLAQKREAELIEQYKATVKNVVKYDNRKYNTDPRHIKVKCITTGEVFWAVKPVLEKFNISRYKLDRAIKLKQPILTGEMFEYIE